MLIEMTIKGVTVDPITSMPIVILRDRDDQKVLPIWVGVAEANAIALQIENVPTPRPMTHDLLRNVIHDLQATVERIVVSDLKENTFYALIHLTDAERSGRRRRAAQRCDRPGTAHERADPGGGARSSTTLGQSRSCKDKGETSDSSSGSRASTRTTSASTRL